MTSCPGCGADVPQPDDLLIASEVAAITRIPEATLAYWRANDRGPRSFKLQHRVVYRRVAVEAWISEQEALSARGGAA